MFNEKGAPHIRCEGGRISMAKSQLRAAAYCRVSTNKAEQLDSYSAQQDFFKEYCQRHEFQLLRIYGEM